jgi:hypothetical protein
MSDPDRVILRFMQDVDQFTGTDGKVYGPFHREDVGTIPHGNAEVLALKKVAEVFTPPPRPDLPMPAPVKVVIPEALQDPAFRFILLKPRDKIPIEGVSWKDPAAQYPRDHPRLAVHLAGGGNYGVICGVKDLVVVDIDHEEIAGALDIPRLLLPTFTVRTSKGTHYYLVSPGARTTPLKTPSGEPVGDIKAVGGYVVGPGSVHPSGAVYTVESTEPIKAVGPEILQEVLDRCAGAGMKAAPVAAPEKDPWFLLPDRIAAGDRNDTLTRYAGHLVDQGHSLYVITWVLDEVNRTRCAPPLPRNEIQGILKSAADWEKPKEPAPRVHGVWDCSSGRLYLEVMIGPGSYGFAYQEADGSMARAPVYLNPLGVPVYPRPLIEKEGVVVPLVGIPQWDLLKTVPVPAAGALLEEIKTHVRRYFDAPDLDVDLLAYYALFTWFYPKVNTLPYLRFLADTGTGKSRAQRVVTDLCFYPMKLAGASTFSGIMRFAEKWRGTLRIDEADLRGGTMEHPLIKYLNLGFEREQFYIMTDKQNPKQQEVFDPFMPKVIAMRLPFEDNATEGRLLSLATKETQRPDLPVVYPPEYEGEVQALRAKIARFVLASWGRVDGSRYVNLSAIVIEPRLKQLGLPLSIVFQLFPEGEGEFIKYLKRRQQELKRIRAQSFEGVLFNTVYDLALGEMDTRDKFPYLYPQPKKDAVGDPPPEPYVVTAAMVKEVTGIKTTTTITKALGSIGFIQDYIKVGKKSVRHLCVPGGKKWGEMWRRYYFTETPEIQASLDANIKEDVVVGCPENLRARTFTSG